VPVKIGITDIFWKMPRNRWELLAQTQKMPAKITNAGTFEKCRQESAGNSSTWRSASDSTEVELGNLTDTRSFSWRTQLACTGAAATQRSSAATRTAQQLVGREIADVVDSWACRRASRSKGNDEQRGWRCYRRMLNGPTTTIYVPLQFFAVSELVPPSSHHLNRPLPHLDLRARDR
jgi:hypothetical protein